jgi:phosphoglycerate dehydrogenase-like enzyme
VGQGGQRRETEPRVYTVFYLNPGATPEVCAIIGEHLPEGWRLLTPNGTAVNSPAPNSTSGRGDFASELAACDFILVADHPVTAAHIASAPRLKMIQHQGVGYERIDLDACRARGIPVALTPEGTSIGVAEHTILLILALYKQLVTAANGVRAGRWPQWTLRDHSFELCGKTLGLIGLGRIGREVAVRARAFDARVVYFDPDVPVPAPAEVDVSPVPSLPVLLATADIVSLHVPLHAGSRHLIDREALRQMKPGAVLINTARGGLVDEAALVDALRSGHLAGAALDVLEREPPPLDHPLLYMDHVLITPHIAAGTCDALRTKMRAAFANLTRFAQGEPLRHVVADSVAAPAPAAASDAASAPSAAASAAPPSSATPPLSSSSSSVP